MVRIFGLADPVRLAVALLIAGLLPLAWGQSGGLRVEAVTPVVEAEPQQTLNLLVRVTNAGVGAVKVAPEFGLFREWRMVVPPGELQLAAGESQVMPFTVRVPVDVAPGSYTFPLVYRGEAAGVSAEAAFTVVVKQLDKLELTLLNAPSMTLSEAYEARFLVRNAGNGVQEVALAASDNLRLGLAVRPAKVRLEPGNTQEVTVAVGAPRELQRAQSHRVRLTAQSKSTPEVSVSANVTVELVPKEISGASAYHTFPLRVQFGNTLSSGSSRGLLGQAAGGWSWSVSGSGRLWDQDPGRLTVRASNDLGFSSGRYSFAYRHPDFWLELGDQSVSLSPLAGGSSGFGLGGGGTIVETPDVQLKGQAFFHGSKQGARFGVRAEVALFDQVDAALQALLEPKGTLIGGEVQFTPRRADPLAFVVSLIDIESAVYFPRDGQGPAWGLRLTGTLTQNRSSLTAAYRWTQAGFRGNARSSYAFSVRGTLRLNEMLGLTTQRPFTLNAWYEQSGERAETGEPYRSSAQYGAALSGRTGDTSLGLSFEARSVTKEALAGSDWQGKLTFSVSTPLFERVPLQQSLSWQQSYRAEEADWSHALAYHGSTRFPLLGGRLSPSLRLGFDATEGVFDTAQLGASWSGRVTDELSLSLDAHYNLVGSEALRFSVGGGYRFDSGRRLELAGSSRFYRDRGANVQLRFGYTVPLDVPLGRLSTVGAVSGVIRDDAGAGLAGLVVQLAGQAVVTRADGTFHLPAVPEGRHYLSLRAGGLAPHQLVIPGLPYGLELNAHEDLTLDLTVVDSARVSGKVVYQKPSGDDAGDFVFGSGRAADGEALVRGVVVELRQGDTSLRAVTNAKGEFTFTHLLPGEWTLQVRRGSLPEHYRLEPETTSLVLEPAEAAVSDIQLVPVARRIQFMDGGTVGSP